MALSIPLQWLDMEKHQETLVHHPFTSTFLFIFSIFIILKMINGPRSVKLNLPPSPPKLPIIGNLHQVGLLLHQSIHRLSEKYGPLMLLHFGYAPLSLIVSSAEMVREIKVNHEIPFADRPITTASKMLHYGSVGLVFTPHGKYWRLARKISVMELLSTKKVQSFKFVREEEVALMIEKVSRLCSVGTPINIAELVTGLTNDIVCRCALGRKHGGQDGNDNFGQIASKVGKLLTSFCFGDLFPRLGWMDILTGSIGRIKKVSRDLDYFFDQIIDEHVKNKNNCPDYNKDFVDILLQVQKDNINFTRDNIKALILDMFVGGTETTSTTIEWAMAELVTNPNVMQKAQEEVRKVAGKKNKVDEEDLQKMNYLKSVIKETLRLRPAVSLNIMETSSNTTVKGYHVPAKTRVFINIWSIHRDPSYWDRPEKFMPERFINKNTIDLKGHDFNYIPFGSGRRGCPGMSFAMVVIELAIANLLYWFDWKTPGDEDLDMTESFGITVSKNVALHLVPIAHFS